MILQAGVAVLRTQTGWHRWSFDGYTPADPPAGAVTLLTPEPLARLMALGWRVGVHPSAG